jgi:hypothetical protein
MTLPAMEFIRRFLLHVLPDGFMRIRHFGFLANRAKRENLSRCRQILGLSPALPQPSDKTIRQQLLELTGIDWFQCPCCKKGTMIVIQPKKPRKDRLPVLIEAKSAGDFTNTNKRRKEEATKIHQLQATYGASVTFVLFLCGYFGSDYLGYEAAEGIDWVWEHRIDDLAKLGL